MISLSSLRLADVLSEAMRVAYPEAERGDVVEFPLEALRETLRSLRVGQSPAVRCLLEFFGQAIFAAQCQARGWESRVPDCRLQLPYLPRDWSPRPLCEPCARGRLTALEATVEFMDNEGLFGSPDWLVLRELLQDALEFYATNS